MKIKAKHLEFAKGEEVSILITKYHTNKNPAIVFVCNDGSPYGNATVNTDEKLPEGYALIRNTEECEGMLPELQDAGVIGQSEQVVKSGYIDLHLCKLLIKE